MAKEKRMEKRKDPAGKNNIIGALSLKAVNPGEELHYF